ncbi:hypothetical protein EDB84DRAFT_1264688 [Lactarius hengduanensis]|nr:hypothetical protein EDB84DRAFT_1264688 [Lactarius hengduanensis]
MSDTELPPYSEVHEPSPLYSSSQPLASSSSGSRDKPLTFHVGLHELQDSLVKIKHLKLHLCFLGALHDLRKKVQSKTYATWPPLIRELDGERRWSWFVNLAVERSVPWFIFYRTHSPNSFAVTMPPLDVWMVLHAYLLSPQSFAEDCVRIGSLKPLAILTVSTPDFFLDALVSRGPNSSSRQNWVTKTGLSFDPFDCAATLSDQELLCPKCKAVVNVPYVTAEEMGYAQQKFSRACPFCTFEITRETLAVAKLTTDLTAHLTPHTNLSGTLRNELGEDTARAVEITQNLLNLKPIDQFNSHKWQEDQGTSVAMAESLGWKLSEIKKSLSKLENPNIISKVLGAYADQRPFSVDLIGAVLRQGSFVRNIYDLGWTSSSYFEKHEDAAVLHHAIVRYHAFLDLMSSSQMVVVPTLDIDLVWHSHQLSGPRYHKDCRTNVGRYIDHDDKVEQFHLSDAFDATCRAWEKRYGIPYTQCGRPLTIGQKLARLVPLLGSKHSGSKHPLARRAPPADRSEILAASRPSDHDTVAVLGLPYNFAAKPQCDNKALRRREREVSRVPIGGNMALGSLALGSFAGCGGCRGGGCASGGGGCRGGGCASGGGGCGGGGCASGGCGGGGGGGGC